MDQIFLRDLEANGIIGVNEGEREKPQKILINVVLYADLSRAGHSDDIQDSVDYALMAKKVLEHAESANTLTVEALASELAAVCLSESRVQRVRVRVEKPQAIPFCASVGVEIERSRTDK